MIYCFFKFDFQSENSKRNGKNLMGLLGFQLQISGRFLCPYFAVFQLMSIRCGFSFGDCSMITDQPRFYISCLCILINITIIYVNQFYNNSDFPNSNIPWSKCQTNLRWIESTLYYTNSFILAFIDILTETHSHKFTSKDSYSELMITNSGSFNLSYYIVLLPSFLILTLLIIMKLKSFVFYNQTVSVTKLLRDCVLWSLLVVAICSELFQIQADFSYIIIAVIFFMSIFSLSNRYRENLMKRVLKDTSQFQSTEQNLKQYLDFFVYYTLRINDDFSYNLIRNAFYKHQHSCTELEKCPSNIIKKIKFQKIQQNLLETDKKFQEEILKLKGAQNEEVQTQQTDHEGEELNIDYYDLKMGYPSYNLIKAYYETIFFHAQKQKLDSNRIVLQEVFIKIFYYNQIISSYYKLMGLKQRLNQKNEKEKHNFLHNLILQTYQNTKKKHAEFNVEKVMRIEREQIKYKKTILDATLQVQKFWLGLSSKKVDLSELMAIGNKIVDSYFRQKESYDVLLQIMPDPSQIALYNIQFSQNVMNFEIEALEANNLYKKIIEKQKVLQKNFYTASNKNYALVIVANKKTKKNLVMLVNQLFEDVSGIMSSKVVGKNVTALMPPQVAEIHDRLIQNYLGSFNGVPYSRDFNRIWLKRVDDTILPIKAYILTCISQNYGLILVTMAEVADPIPISNTLFQSTDLNMLLCDDKGTIVNTSPNFIKSYFSHKDSPILDYRFNFRDLFPLIDTFTDDELLEGVKTKYNKFFYRTSTFPNAFPEEELNDHNKFVNVQLRIIRHNLKLGLHIQEVVFIEYEASQQENLSLDFQIESYPKQVQEDKEESISFQSVQSGEMSMLESSQSSNSSNTDTQRGMIQIKNMLDFKRLPQSIVNFRRAITLFFLVMIATAITMLVVTMISHSQFKTFQDSTLNSIFISRELSNLRMTYRMLMFIAVRGNISTYLTYDNQISQLNYFFGRLKQYENNLIKNNHNSDAILFNLTVNPELYLEEIEFDGSIDSSIVTYFSGTQQLLSKISPFLEMSEQDWITAFQGYQPLITLKGLTDTQKNAWFIEQNSNHNIRDYTAQLVDRYIYVGANQEQNYRQTLIIILCICIVLTILSTILLSPIASNLDNEEIDVVQKWSQISKEGIKDVLQRIDVFLNWLNKVEEEKNNQNQGSQVIVQDSSIANIGDNFAEINDRSISSDKSFDTLMKGPLNKQRLFNSGGKYIKNKAKMNVLNNSASDQDTFSYGISYYESVIDPSSNDQYQLRDIEAIQDLESTTRNLIDQRESTRNKASHREFKTDSMYHVDQKFNSVNQKINYISSDLNLQNIKLQNKKILTIIQSQAESALIDQNEYQQNADKNTKTPQKRESQIRQIRTVVPQNFKQLSLGKRDTNQSQKNQNLFRKTSLFKGQLKQNRNVQFKIDPYYIDGQDLEGVQDHNQIQINIDQNQYALNQQDISFQNSTSNFMMEQKDKDNLNFSSFDMKSINEPVNQTKDSRQVNDDRLISFQNQTFFEKSIKQIRNQKQNQRINAKVKQSDNSLKKIKENTLSSQSSNQISSKLGQPQEQLKEERKGKDNIMKQVDLDHKQLKKIFKLIKIKRLSLFLMLNLIIISFFVGQFVITDQVIQDASDSFQLQQIFSQRETCLSTTLNLIMEMYAQNQSQSLAYENETLMQYVTNDCSQIEQRLLEYTKNSPPQLDNMIDTLRQYNTNKACQVGFSNQDDIDSCLLKINGIMDLGLRTAIQNIYFYAINEIIYFQSLSGSQRTISFLKNRIFTSQLQYFMDLLYDTIIPISYSLSDLVYQSINDYLDNLLKEYFIVFGVFVAFLLITLLLIFRYALIILRRIVLRTRMLIKIIPIEELKRIIEQKKENEKYDQSAK